MPLHPRLSLSPTPGEMAITWSSPSGGGGGVQWWVDATGTVGEGVGVARAYGPKDMCGGRAVDEGYRDTGEHVRLGEDAAVTLVKGKMRPLHL